MEKEPQPESLSAVTIKPEYAPSEYSSEPPPAYHKSQSSAVQVAKIVAVTVVLVSVVLGSFLLASAYVTANASCRQLEQELELLSEAADRFQPPPQPEALIQEGPIPSKRQSDPLETEESQKNAKDIDNNNIDSDSDGSSDSSDRSSDSSQSSESEEEERTPIHIKLPLQLDFDDLAGALIEKNQRSRMNCIVEKKRAEEVVDHQPKTVRLPFGVNLTTDPRFERLSGERMVILCESGHIQRAQPPPQLQPQPQPEEDQEDTIMIQPVMIPIPHTPFQTHMPQQMQPIVQQEPQPMRLPVNPMNQIHPMESMRPPVPPMMQAQVQMQPQPQPQPQGDFPPSMILHHIVQQIIAQKIMESEKAREEQQQQQIQQQQMQQQQLHQQPMQQQQPQPQEVEVEPRPQHRFQVAQNMVGQRIPIPEEVLTQLNRLPNRDVIVAVSEPESEENSQEVRFIQEPRQSAAEMNGRQAFARGLPVHIPVSMMPQEPEQEQEPQAVASEEPRPHYVQPRSVRSVDAVLGKDQKRVKRCACDCAC